MGVGIAVAGLLSAIATAIGQQAGNLAAEVVVGFGDIIKPVI